MGISEEANDCPTPSPYISATAQCCIQFAGVLGLVWGIAYTTYGAEKDASCYQSRTCSRPAPPINLLLVVTAVLRLAPGPCCCCCPFPAPIAVAKFKLNVLKSRRGVVLPDPGSWLYSVLPAPRPCMKLLSLLPGPTDDDAAMPLGCLAPTLPCSRSAAAARAGLASASWGLCLWPSPVSDAVSLRQGPSSTLRAASSTDGLDVSCCCCCCCCW
jgi:hypothetical protein